VPSPQKGHRTGIDSLLRESEPDGFTEVCTETGAISVLMVTQPLSLAEHMEGTEKNLEDALALFRSQKAHMNLDWYARFCALSNHLFKFVDDNIRDETCRTLLKTNERDRCNQPLPQNIMGRHFGTFTRQEYSKQ